MEGCFKCYDNGDKVQIRLSSNEDIIIIEDWYTDWYLVISNKKNYDKNMAICQSFHG